MSYYADPPPGKQPAASKSSGSSGMTIVLIILAVAFGGMLVCGGILLAMLLPAVSAGRQAAQRAMSMNNLRQIGLALHNYHDTYGSFPAAFIEDENGQPRSSWRTAILPFLEQQPLYDRYDSNRAWDDPVNQNVVSQMVSAFQSPRDPDISGNSTSYLALTGNDAVLSGAEFTKIQHILDGTSNTVVVVEVIGSQIPWASPQDLPLDSVQLSGQPGDLDPQGVLALFADGSVQYLEGVTRQQLQSMASRSDQSRP